MAGQFIGGGASLSDVKVRYQSGSDFADGTLVQTDIPATAANGDSFVIEISGKSYGTGPVPHFVVAEGYLYNSTIINYSGSNMSGDNMTYIKAMEYNGVLCFWWPRYGYWNSYDVHVRSASSQGNGHNRVTSITNSVDPTTATKKVQINLAKSWNSSNDGSGSGLDADLLDGIQATSFLRSDTADTASGSITFSATNYHSGNSYSIYGPNTGWSRYLNVGGNGYSGDATHASVATTNGNLHLDSSEGGFAVYLNWYGGTSGTFFGNGASGQVGRVDGAGTATFSGDVTAYSDARLKTDVANIEGALDKVSQLNGVTFTRTTDNKRSTGVIAQEVEAVLPEAVNTDEEGMLSVKYGNMVGLLIEAVKELKEENAAMKAEIAALKGDK